MGGVASRFDENDWSKANGKLQTAEETIDGARPTSEYEVYSLVKRSNLGVGGQREFDLLDSHSNLIYTTRAVEGTIAWFDVLGRDMDDYIIRVQADLTRRFWIIYTFGKPTFAGQLPDQQATKKAFSDSWFCNGEPFLYRKACMTVTWARFEGIVAFYGPPSQDEVQHHQTGKSTETDTSSSEDPLIGTDDHEEDDKTTIPIDPADVTTNGWLEPQFQIDASDTTKECFDISASVDEMIEMTKNGSTRTLLEPFPQNCEDASWTTDTQLDDHLSLFEDSSSTLLVPFPQGQDQTLLTSNPQTSVEMIPTDATENPSQGIAKGSFLRYLGIKNKHSFAKKDNNTDKVDSSNHNIDDNDNNIDDNDNTNYALSRDKMGDDGKRFSYENLRSLVYNVKVKASRPQEGVLMNPKPMLKVQEIHSFTGKHQTLLPTSEDYRHIENKIKSDNTHTEGGTTWDEENSLASNNRAIDPNSSDGEVIEEIPPKGRVLSDAISSSSSNETNDQKLLGSDDDESLQFTETGQSRNPSTSIAEKRTTGNDVHNLDGASLVEAWPNAGTSEDDLLPSLDAEEKQPLVGFWSWENTFAVHQMKMHVAKGSDLALHLILAIVTNQLRYERNAAITTSL